MTAADLAERLLGIGNHRMNLDHLIEELRPETGTGWEGPLLEFKATYRPSPKHPDADADQPDKFIWNVLEAFIGLANASGGCVVLGIGEKDGAEGKILFPGDWDPDGILTRPGKEDKDLRDHLPKIFYGPIANGQRRLAFSKRSKAYQYALSGENCNRLKSLVEFHPCRSQKLNCNAIVAIVRPVAKDEMLISVKRTVNGETESVVFHRNPIVARNESITDIEELDRYRHSREPARTAFGEILHRPFKRGPLQPAFFSTVPAPTVDFIGRESELTHLDKLCHEGKIPLIHAGGGTGKTQLAFKYAQQHAGDYTGGCFHIPAENAKNWDDALQTILEPRANALGISPMEWLGLKQDPKEDPNKLSKDGNPNGKKGKSERQITTVDIVNAIIRCTRGRGKVLLVLDNVEKPTDFFTNERLAKAFPQGPSPDIAILATSRTNKGIRSRATSVAGLHLGDLSETNALALLNRGESFADEEEHHAAREIVRLLGYRALYISRVAKLADERARRSYKRILAKLLADKLLVVQPREDEDDCRAPAVIWNWTREHLLRTTDGQDDVRLAQSIALFPADGVQDRILEAIWYSNYGKLGAQETLDAYRDDPDLFQDALKRLSEFSLIQYTPEEHVVRMHRLDRAAIQQDSDIAIVRPQLGRALETCLCMGPQDWVELAKAKSDFIDFCPIERLDGDDLSEILSHRPEFASQRNIPWGKFYLADWWNLLIKRPEFVEQAETREIPLSPILAKFIPLATPQLSPQDFCGAVWARVLSAFPERITDCPIERLGKDDWLHLLANRPGMIDLCPHPEILNVPGHRHEGREYSENSIWDVSEWGLCLHRQPQLAEYCKWDNLTHDDVVAILKEAPDFANRIPRQNLALVTGQDWTEIAQKHPPLALLFPFELFPRKWGLPSHLLDDVAYQYGFRDDNGLDWAKVYQKRPEILDFCATENLHPLHWCKLLLVDPSLVRLNPPWEKIGPLAQKKTKDMFGFAEDSPFSKLLELKELTAYRTDDLPLSLSRPSAKKKSVLDKSISHAPCLLDLTDERISSLKESDIRSILEEQPQLSSLFPAVVPRTWRNFFFCNTTSYFLDMPGALDFSSWIKEPVPIGDGRFDVHKVPYDDLADATSWLINSDFHSSALKSIHQKKPIGLLAQCKNDHTLVAILICIYPKLADLFDWNSFRSRELCLLMLNRPSLRARCDWAKITGHDWAVILSRNPEFADVCDWTKFSAEDWAYLRDERPWMVQGRTEAQSGQS